MSEKPKSIFRVADAEDRTIARLQASSNAAARRYAASTLVVTKQTTAQIISAAQNGFAVIDVETGKVIGAVEEPGVSAGGTLSEDEE